MQNNIFHSSSASIFYMYCKLVILIILIFSLACSKTDDKEWTTIDTSNKNPISNDPISTPEIKTPSTNQEITPLSSNSTAITSNQTNISTFNHIKNWRAINDFLDKETTKRITAENLEFTGFDLEMHIPYPRQSLRLESDTGTFSTTIEETNEFHIGALIYDGPGNEQYELLINDNIKGRFTASDDNNREFLYVTTQLFNLKKGDQIKFKSDLKDTGNTPSMFYMAHRVEEIVLINKISSPIKNNIYKINNIELNPSSLYSETSNDRLSLTWVTDWESKCVIHIESTQGNSSTTEQRAWTNHKLILDEKISKDIKRFKIECPQNKNSIYSDWIIPNKISPTHNTNIEDYKIGFTVTNDSHFDLNMVPVNVSLPITQSKWWHDSFILRDQSNNLYDTQNTKLSYWQDGSIKWLFIEFLINIKPHQQKLFELEPSPISSQSNSKSNICSEENNSTILNNNRISLNFDNTKKTLASISFDKNGDRIFTNNEFVSIISDKGLVFLTLNDNSNPVFSKNTHINIIRNGPISCLIELTGKIQYSDKSFFKSNIEIQVYKNQNWIDINHTIGFDSKEDKITFKSLELNIPFDLNPAKQFAYGTDVDQSFVSENKELDLLQINDDSWELTSNSNKILTGKRPSGWASLIFETHTISIAVENFWQQWPKSLSTKNNSLNVGLFPSIKNQVSIPQDSIELIKSFYYFGDENYLMPKGTGKTHQLTLSFKNNNDPNPTTYKLIGKVNPSHIVETNVLGKVETFDKNTAPFYSYLFEKMLSQKINQIENNKEYGILNFGDWWGEREVNWGNNEYDTPHGLFQNWLLGGPDISFNLAESAVRHMKNIDVVNYGDEDLIGKMYKHSIGHTGTWYAEPFKDSPANKGSYRPSYTAGHTWINGLIDHYHLTGEKSSLDTALKVADNLASYGTLNYDYTTAREVGSFLLIMTSAYEETGNPYYLNAAQIAFNRLKEKENLSSGGWDRILTAYECDVSPPKIGEKSFMTGILLSGLKKYHLITQDEKALTMLIQASRRVVEEHWNPDIGAFKYSPCNDSSYPTDPNSIILEGIGYAYRLTNDLNLAKPILQNSMMLEIFKDGKGFSFVTRFAHQTLYDQILAQNNLYNVYNPNGISFIVKPNNDPTIISLSSKNKTPNNFEITVLGNDTLIQEELQMLNGATSIYLNSNQNTEYHVRIYSKVKSGINIFSNSNSLHLDLSKGISLMGQKSTRYFWAKVPDNSSNVSLSLTSTNPSQIKIFLDDGTLISECYSNKCSIHIDRNIQPLTKYIKLQITNEFDADLNIEGTHPMLAVFKNQL